VELVLDHGTRIHAVRAGDDWDIESPDGQVMAKIQGALARRESARKAAGIRSRVGEKLSGGRVIGGPRIFGWEEDQKTLRRSEAAIVTELTDRVIAGETPTRLARDMNARGVPLTGLERLRKKQDRLARDVETERDDDARAELREELARVGEKIARYDGRWTATMVKHIVCRPRNCGLQPRQARDRYGKVTGYEVTEITGEWEPILSRARWELAEALLRDPARRRGRRRGRFLLTGLMRCGKCGAPVKSAGSSGDDTRYGCPSCFGVARRSGPCDELVERVMFYALKTYRGRADEPGSPDASYAREVELLAGRAALARLFAAGETDEAAVTAGTAQIREQVDPIRRERRTLKPNASPGVSAEVWRELPRGRKRAIIAEMAEITLLPQGGGTFRPETLRIVPRDKELGPAFAEAIETAAREIRAMVSARRRARGLQPRHEITCAMCGKTVMAGNSRRRYCSQACWRQAYRQGLSTPAERQHERICEICGTKFIAAHQDTKFCGRACLAKSTRSRKRQISRAR
jgi:site-specific DNA recombinase